MQSSRSSAPAIIPLFPNSSDHPLNSCQDLPFVDFPTKPGSHLNRQRLLSDLSSLTPPIILRAVVRISVCRFFYTLRKSSQSSAPAIGSFVCNSFDHPFSPLSGSPLVVVCPFTPFPLFPLYFFLFIELRSLSILYIDL